MIDAVTETHVGKDLKGSGGHSESFQLEKKGSRISSTSRKTAVWST
jgi:hypothetical protein